MIRRLLVLALVLAVIAGAALWFLTAPQTIAESALRPHTPTRSTVLAAASPGPCAIVAHGPVPTRPNRIHAGYAERASPAFMPGRRCIDGMIPLL